MTRALDVFVTGGTGYMGRRLIPALAERGHRVTAFVRPGSEHKLPPGTPVEIGDVLSRTSIADAMPANAIVVHLVGTPRPSPRKAAQFEALDFVAARECIAAARDAGARRIVYVSVAQPAPVMRAYVDVRRRVELLLRHAGVAHTVLRPWYVLGPGHRWPYVLVPMYWALAAFPPTRSGARRLGLVTLPQMIAALVRAVETAGDSPIVFDVPEIRRSSRREKTTA
ncbi:MAG TPA: NAD(P)H-binding protein [Gemmatimonadaceae bacterium]|nr:NAD(P)H-binding protein [Gemmatimonadaceae bacterium]